MRLKLEEGGLLQFVCYGLEGDHKINKKKMIEIFFPEWGRQSFFI
jgi:hypothetical protein